MDFVLDDLDLDLDLVGDFSSDLDLEAEEFEKDFLGEVGSLASFSLLSWEESEFGSLFEGLHLYFLSLFLCPDILPWVPRPRGHGMVF